MRILQFIGKRTLSGLLVMVGVVLVIFVLFNLMPDPARLTLGQRADGASVDAIKKAFRLDLSKGERLMLYFNDLSPISFHNLDDDKSYTHLDENDVKFARLFKVGTTTVVAKAPYLGRSFQSRKKVSEIIGEKIFSTFMLAIFAMIFAAIIGIVMGVLAAINQNTWFDNTALVLSTLGISQPAYFSGIIIAMIFGYYLSDWTGLPLQGDLLQQDDMLNNIVVWKNLVLPVIALGIRPIAIITQLTRSAMLDVLSQDYIRTARAKGLGFFAVTFKHALRNAMNPVVTSISGWLAALFTGAYFIESVFNFNGLGYATIQSIQVSDFPVVMGITLFVAFIFVVMNLLTDILYSLLDPRVTVKA